MSDLIINICVFASSCLLLCLAIWVNIFFLFYFYKQKRDK